MVENYTIQYCLKLYENIPLFSIFSGIFYFSACLFLFTVIIQVELKLNKEFKWFCLNSKFCDMSLNRTSYTIFIMLGILSGLMA
jgi:hypothetical protein